LERTVQPVEEEEWESRERIARAMSGLLPEVGGPPVPESLVP
jgi:hypothetical protein